MKQSVQEYLGVPSNWPVVEKVKHSIVLMPTKTDIRKAKKKDPLCCALHNAACRQLNVPSAAIGGRWAYIPQRDEKGKFYIARMQATPATQKAIRAFDETGAMPEGGFEFKPISASQRFANKAKYMRAYHKGTVGGTQKPRGKIAKRGSQTRITRQAKTRSIPMNVRSS